MSAATALPDYQPEDPRLHELDPAERRAMQDERLVAMVAYVHSHSAFWRRKLDDAGVSPADVRGIADIGRLPFVTRAELQEDQAANPPFGGYTCSPPERWRRVFTTSGTSGRRLRRVFSERDWDYALTSVNRRSELDPGALCMVLSPVDGLVGPTAGCEAWQRAGGVVLLAGLYDTETRARLIAELGPVQITGVASYLVHLSEVAGELGLDLAGAGVRRLQSVGEPGAAVPATKALLMERYGCEEVVDGYGMTEVQPIGGSCSYSPTLHTHWDLVLTECLDPETGQPVAHGELGELVYTSLAGDTQPVLRYRSRDLGRLSPSDQPCACGFTGPRILAIEGRTDEMIWYRGVNVFPSAIEQVIRNVPGLAAEYRIVVDRRGKLPKLMVEVEAETHSGAAVVREADVEQQLRSALGVQPDVSIGAPGSIPRATGDAKVRRVVEVAR